MKRAGLLLFFTFYLPPFSFHLSSLSADSGATSANFLQENLSARQAAMGGVFTALNDDSGSLQTNPAGLSLLGRPEMNLSYASMPDQSSYALSAYALPVKSNPSFKLAFGAGLNYYSAGNIDVNFLDGTTRSFKAETGYSGSLALSAKVRKFIALGISPKFVRSTLVEQFSAQAFAADLGVMVFPFPTLLKDRLVLGAAIQNLGTKMTYKTESRDLPRVDSLGASLRLWDARPDYGSILGSLQAERSLGENMRYRFGGEYVFGGKDDERSIALRGGTRIQFEGQNYGFGVGLREKNFELNYAFVNGVDLESTHRLTLIFHFGKYRPERGASKEETLDFEKEMKPEETQLIRPPSRKSPSMMGEEKGQTEYQFMKDLKK